MIFMMSKIILSIFDYMNKQSHEALNQRQRLITMTPGLTPKKLTLSSIPGVGSDIAKSLRARFHFISWSM